MSSVPASSPTSRPMESAELLMVPAVPSTSFLQHEKPIILTVQPESIPLKIMSPSTSP